MTGSTTNLPGAETQPPFTEEERKHLTEEEIYELSHQRFEEPPPGAEPVDPNDQESTDVYIIIDDIGTIESVSLITDAFDIPEDI